MSLRFLIPSKCHDHACDIPFFKKYLSKPPIVLAPVKVIHLNSFRQTQLQKKQKFVCRRNMHDEYTLFGSRE